MRPVNKTTMDEMYGDGSDHEACPSCGFCKTCDDCKNLGCGSSDKNKLKVSKHASSSR